MANLYRKTEKGQAEVTTRANRLPPRFRAALIMVDGKRSEDELSGMIPAEPEATLRWLTDSGFIERLEASANTSMWGATGAGTDSLQDKPSPAAARIDTKTGAKPPAISVWPEGPSASRTPIDRIKKDAVREMLGLVGPMGEDLAVKIERARSREELKPLLEMGYKTIANVRGASAANEFHAKYIEGLMV